MDHAVAIVEAYLQINGYFTVAEYPVIEALGPKQYSTATDLDVLAVRFAGAGRIVPGGGSSFAFQPDPKLGIDGGQPDMLIAEVKEGRAEINPTAFNPDVLKVVLARFGCCSAGHASKTAAALIRKGSVVTHTGHRVRLLAFGSTLNRTGRQRYASITLGHVIEFIEGYLHDHWAVLRHAHFKHPALGQFMVRKKALTEGRKG
ncbi:hypothetical protein [Elongatibacter sediminis]|uniref:Restriction endonuclease n=1 Tax=Elongatibacter sediminis TaxID=3119006 RepID=A0AAW9RMR8_9GAMM